MFNHINTNDSIIRSGNTLAYKINHLYFDFSFLKQPSRKFKRSPSYVGIGSVKSLLGKFHAQVPYPSSVIKDVPVRRFKNFLMKDSLISLRVPARQRKNIKGGYTVK